MLRLLLLRLLRVLLMMADVIDVDGERMVIQMGARRRRRRRLMRGMMHRMVIVPRLRILRMRGREMMVLVVVRASTVRQQTMHRP